MAPSRGKGKARPGRAATSSERGAKASARTRGISDVPDVYQSLLDEAATEDARCDTDRPLKRRKVAGRKETPESQSHTQPITVVSRSTTGAKSVSPHPVAYGVQTIEESSEDEDTDLEFEDVDLNGFMEPNSDLTDGIQDVSISLQAESGDRKKTTQSRRKPATYAEKAHRLMKPLRSLLTAKMISYLNPKADDTQFQRNRSFMDGLNQALDAFVAEFRISAGGLSKPRWEVDGDAPRKHDMPPPLDRADFIAAAKDLEGSQDTANQLFCALLRAVGVDTRIVCSLQVLPYTTVPKQSTPKKPVKTRIFAIAPDTPRKSGSVDDAAVRGSTGIGSVPSVRRRLGQPTFAVESSKAPPARNKTQQFLPLAFPVFWVEAFNAAQQKWIAVDPIVTRTINKSSQLEPSATYEPNQMTYVIAFEADGTARDVTKRYAKAYNAKTRRHRVEASADGAKWFKKAMRIFRRPWGALDRDQVEDSELAQKEAREGMPANVQDFKDHPYYALERHLKRHEVIYPQREVGKVNAGTAAKPRVEPVYRAQDVFVCKSADKWYRLGREIKEGEQPLKHVPAQSRRQKASENDDQAEDLSMTGLYAPYQTQLYVPPPVQRGHIPKNLYGNLDIYVPSMVPAGAVHVRHGLAQQAARVLRVDFVDAVTGFKFQGRQGTAVMEGVVVAQQHEDAVRAAIEGLENDVMMDQSKARSLVALRLWKHFMAALKIAERISIYTDETSKEADITDYSMDRHYMHTDILEQDDDTLATAGQFSLRELTKASKPMKQKKHKKTQDSDEEFEARNDKFSEKGEEPGGFVVEDDMDRFIPDQGDEGGFMRSDFGEGGFTVETEINDDESLVPQHDHGGFMVDGEHAGGFVQEDASTTHDELFSEADVAQNASSLETNQHNLTSDAGATISSQPTEVMDTDDKSDIGAQLNGIKDENVGLNAREPMTSLHREDGSDKASILSHDPEDDDAEPDWLESD